MIPFWQKYRRWIRTLILIAGLFFIIGFSLRYHVPRIKRWLLVEIEAKSRELSPIRVWPQSLDLHLIPFGLTLENVRILPQKGLETTLAPTEIERVRLSLSLVGLIKGQLRLSEILISGSEAHLIIRSPTDSEKKLPEFNFEMLDHIPIESIVLEKIKISGLLQETGVAFQVEDLNWEIENKFRTLRTALLARQFKIKSKGEDALFDADIKTRALLDEEGLYFSQAQVKRQDSFLSATGSLTGDVLAGKINQIRAKVRGDWHLEQIRLLAAELMPKLRLPTLTGQMQFETYLDIKNKNQFKIGYNANAKNLTVDRYNVGQAQVAGNVTPEKLNISQLKMSNNFGQIHVDDFGFYFAQDNKFSGRLSSQAAGLKNLLAALGLPHVPVDAQLAAKLPCSGVLQPRFTLTCEGELQGRDLVVKIDKKPAPLELVHIPDIKVMGAVTINTQSVQYKTQIEIQKSKGTSNGTIDYATGFKINYETPGLDLAYVKNLIGLKPEGVFSLKGSTVGNSQTAVIDMVAQGDNAWLYDYHLGKIRFGFRYRKGVLHFDSVEGLLGATQYLSKIKIDTHKDYIELDGTLPFLDAEDLPYALSRKFTFPIQMTGTGSGKIKLFGPLNPKKLSYDFNTALFRGSLFNESYDQIQAHLVSQQGTLDFKNLQLRKGKSLLSADGQLTPDSKIKLNIIGRNFLVEQSENLTRFKVNMTGNFNFDVNMRGTTEHPLLDAQGQLTRAAIGDVAIQDSALTFSLTEKELAATARLAGGVVEAELSRDLDLNGKTAFKTTARNWNFAQTFSIFSDSLRNGTYQTLLSGQAEASFLNKNPELFDARILVDRMFLKNGRAELATTAPLKLTALAGVIQTENFELTGDNTFLRLKSSPAPKGQLNLNAEGRLDMSLLTLLTPFLDDLRGTMSLSLQAKGAILKPDFTGSIFAKDALVKLKGFPHAFEQLSGDTILNNEKIIINSIRGKLGGGLINGSGQIQLKGLSDVPVDIRGQMNDVKLNVPDGFTTRGSGEFFVKGNWFPYTVGALYNIESGSIEKRGVAQTKTTPEIKPSLYLPKYLTAQRFSPISLALDVNIRKDLPVKLQISRIDIRADVIGQMKVNGPPDAPLLTGRVNINRGGKVTFRNNTFEIISGLVEYQNAPPENPTLNVQAQARVTAQLKNNDTRDYDVDLRVLGTAANPKINMYSEPSLPETELLSLLTLGIISESATEATENETTAGEQIANTSYQLGSAFINEQLGINRALESRFGVQFDFNSSYDTSDNAEKHKFTLRKQWTPKFGTSASREIGKTNTNNVKAEYKLNRNLSVIGEWEGKEATGAEQMTDTTQKGQNLFGLDIEYKVEFK